jgi:hypothetical protein
MMNIVKDCYRDYPNIMFQLVEMFFSIFFLINFIIHFIFKKISKNNGRSPKMELPDEQYFFFVISITTKNSFFFNE